MNLGDAVADLEREIRESRQALETSRIESARYFLDHALARYLWVAASTSETTLAAVQARKGGGAVPLKRQLHEALINVTFIVSSEDPDLLAAKSALKDLLDWRELWQLHATVVGKYPGYPFPPIPEEWQADLAKPPDQLVKELDRVSRKHGGSADLFARAYAELMGTRYWHWSGIPRPRMIEELERRGQMDSGSAAIATMMTKLYNVGAHASPAWSQLDVDIRDGGRHVFPDPGTTGEEELVELATTAAHFLSGIRQVVSTRLLRTPPDKAGGAASRLQGT